ncbi:neuronal-specific septin-3-like isoform X2 [Argiope bruennichi]|uniref:Septin-9 like protein n=1 Tax=Argiope bruennichi TaxID=94029 RepID=A0A8T0ERH2_ARGBR|nr:neuronal-specific septin-3-like isoform X2 [Argiope bruennichi]KAF8777036.1 Septin-9 like protein [Argiope bruennichi]
MKPNMDLVEDHHVVLPEQVEDVLKDSFLEADTEGRGYIDCQNVISVVRRALGISLNNHEREKILKKAEILAGRGQLSVNAFITVMADTLTETTQWGNLKTDVAGYVGIDTLQEQIRKKVLKKGFEFNIIVVGRSGLGKSTLINTLFKASVSRRTCVKDEADENGIYKIPKTTEVKSVSHVLEEKGVRLRLTVTDTPGFGDHINNENCWLPILDYINQQYEKYLSEEQSVARKKYIPDTRVHCCLYFIPPTGHSLTPLDVEFMKKLDKIVNIVPVIAKADTLTVEERISFKQRIKQDLEKNGINIYPINDLEEEPEDVVANNKIREMIPFAVVGSNVQHQINGRTIYGRKTQWGTVEVENRAHCEFPDLRDMLIRTHMQDLVDVTRLVHYENFRHQKLRSQDHRHLNGGLNGQVVDIENLNESSL